ncbi:flagellar biosynthetic protein FliO [Vogesella urethralis]|uniref:flagellar biosynthetic protein FliO n=1 Tax=Vogesella urethralis TaxID=2592656 RepID=UPI001F0DDC43|nr:flagellar biosynthetic protein FliO [Vogesella urethralis]
MMRSLVILALLAGPAWAAAPPVEGPSPLWSLLQMLFGLAIVLAAIVGVAWLFRRFTMGGGMLGRLQPARVVSGVMVGPHERLVIVELEGEWLVLGVTSRSVNLLKTLDKPPQQDAANVTPATPPFAQWLAAAIEKSRKRQGGEGE